MGQPVLKSTTAYLKEDYDELKIAYEREKKARSRAEEILETRANHLYKINQQLSDQYFLSSKRNQEFEYLYKVTKIESNIHKAEDIFGDFLEISSKLIWAEMSFCFKCNMKEQSLEPVRIFSLSEHDNLETLQEKFKKENFHFLELLMDSEHPVKFSGFYKNIIKLNPNYNLNHSYLFPMEIDEEEKYLFWFAYPKNYELPQESLDLISNGSNQVKSFLLKNKVQAQVLENYKKLKEIKTQLIQSEKMASLGTISAGIAHEINNPLSFLLTNLEVLKEYLISVGKYIEALEKSSGSSIEVDDMKGNIQFILEDVPNLMSESLEGIERIREIVNGLRTFSRADDGIFKEVDVNNSVDTALKLVSNELKHKGRVVRKFEEIPSVIGSQGQLIQVFTNLLVNSAQAIEEHGTIEVRTQCKNDKVIIAFSDTGKGISKDNLNNLFTPFFTTKPTGQGTGLGLSISYGIIQKHDGNIFVESTVGQGTTFYIELPVKEKTK
jgi:two-component system NtrC family sensor kinase